MTVICCLALAKVSHGVCLCDCDLLLGTCEGLSWSLDNPCYSLPSWSCLDRYDCLSSVAYVETLKRAKLKSRTAQSSQQGILKRALQPLRDLRLLTFFMHVMESLMQAEGRSQTASVRLYPSEEIVTVRLKELGEIEDKPKYDSQPDEQKQVKKISRAGESADSAAPLSDKFREQQLDDRQAHGNETSQRPWLAPHIRVKVIDKRKSHGK